MSRFGIYVLLTKGKMKSKIFTLDTRDLINGLIIAFLTALLTGIIEIMGNGAIFTWLTLKPVLIARISAGLPA